MGVRKGTRRWVRWGFSYGNVILVYLGGVGRKEGGRIGIRGEGIGMRMDNWIWIPFGSFVFKKGCDVNS
jgi:hypothetical protein